MKYKGIVCARYYQEIVVEADSESEARGFMANKFDVNDASSDGCDIYDVEEVK